MFNNSEKPQRAPPHNKKMIFFTSTLSNARTLVCIWKEINLTCNYVYKNASPLGYPLGTTRPITSRTQSLESTNTAVVGGGGSRCSTYRYCRSHERSSCTHHTYSAWWACKASRARPARAQCQEAVDNEAPWWTPFRPSARTWGSCWSRWGTSFRVFRILHWAQQQELLAHNSRQKAARAAGNWWWVKWLI